MRRAIFKAVGTLAVAAAGLVAVTLLVFTIHKTAKIWPWPPFLYGMLVSALLALIDRAARRTHSKRREARISRLQMELMQENQLRVELENKLAKLTQPGISTSRVANQATASTHAPSNGPATQDTSTYPVQKLYFDSLSDELEELEDPINRMLKAIENNAFRLYCQRISPLAPDSRLPEHYEVLIRLKEEEEGLMPPGAFFTLVEDYGLMPQLDRWVVQQVIEWLGRNPDRGDKDGHSCFFINLSAESIQDPSFPDFVVKHLERNKVPPQSLCFEIVQVDLSLLKDDIARFVGKIRQQGCVALCNFGSSGVFFETPHRLSMDYLKIDGSIIRDILQDPTDFAQVAAIAKVSKSIGIRTVAELVESEECAATLRSMGVDYAQGFGISSPVALDDLHSASRH